MKLRWIYRASATEAAAKALYHFYSTHIEWNPKPWEKLDAEMQREWKELWRTGARAYREVIEAEPSVTDREDGHEEFTP